MTRPAIFLCLVQHGVRLLKQVLSILREGKSKGANTEKSIFFVYICVNCVNLRESLSFF